LLQDSRRALGRYLTADPEDLILIENATHGVNFAVQSLNFSSGDEILITSDEYSAFIRLWKRLEEKFGVIVKAAELDLPIKNSKALADNIWRFVTPRTRLLYFSHITSLLSLALPAEELCKRARDVGITTVID